MSIYQNGKIYALRSFNTTDIYIGSTIQNLNQRLNEHVYSAKHEDRYKSSKCIIDAGKYWIELIEDYPCDNLVELRKREHEYITHYQNICVNRKKAYGTHQDKLNYQKEYNKTRERKDANNARDRQRVICPICNKDFNRKYLKKHITNMH